MAYSKGHDSYIVHRSVQKIDVGLISWEMVKINQMWTHIYALFVFLLWFKKKKKSIWGREK